MLSGTIFLFAGALLSEPIILLLGQVQVALLAIAFMLLVPGAIALDRRRVRVEIDADASGLASDTHLVGQPVRYVVKLINESRVNLYAVSAKPFGAEGLALTSVQEAPMLSARTALRKSFEVIAQMSGRLGIHGFDVCICDPLGLIETKDYLPCTYPMEFYPRFVRQRRKMGYDSRAIARREGGRHAVSAMGLGTDVRELRDHLPGDPLRHIAWKATVRRGKLMSKNYEHETALSVYLLLDISSSMRGGQRPGQKLERAMELSMSIADQVLRNRDSVGMITFDEKLYGHIAPSSSPQQVRRLLQHLIGLQSIVDADLTELDDDEVEALVVDYLLIQDRLDFRKGDDVDELSGINSKLLRRWVNSVIAQTRDKYQSPSLVEGISQPRASRLRQFAQLRGLRLPYRVEARLGMKERGLVESIEQIVRSNRGKHMIVVITDLCGIMNLDLLTRGVRLATLKGHRLKFMVPFTPSFYDPLEHASASKYQVLRDLFTSAEREERERIIQRLRSLNVEVEWVRSTTPGLPSLQEVEADRLLLEE